MYTELLDKKNAGSKFNLRDLTRKQLYEMYARERYSKREIADLCSCTVYAVRSRLYREGITIFDRCYEDIMKAL